MKRRILSVLLSLCLLLGLLSTTAFAQNIDYDYVALGDSISTGYGLEDAQDSFSDWVSMRMNTACLNLAGDGYTASDVLAQLNSLTGEQRYALENARLITLTVGGNDLMGALYQHLTDVYNLTNDPDITVLDMQRALMGDETAPITQSSALTLLMFNLGAFVESMDPAVEGFQAQLTMILTTLRTLNPTAQIVLTNQYNPYAALADIAAIANLVAQFETGVGKLNTAIQAAVEAAADSMLSLADVHTAFAQAVAEGNNPCNASATSLLDINPDFHPNALGHELIAKAIDAVLSLPSADKVAVNGINILKAENYTVACGEGTATYDEASNTLTLNNAEITTAYLYQTYYYKSTMGIYSSKDLNIVLEGTNTIRGEMDESILVKGALSFQGTGTLEASSIDADGDVTISECTIRLAVPGDGGDGFQYGLYSYSMMKMESGVLDIRCAEEGQTYHSGIYSRGMTMQGGRVSIQGSRTGIHALNGATEITGGQLTAVGEEGCGLIASSLKISSGELNLTGSVMAVMSADFIEVSGQPTITATAMSQDGYGFYSYGLCSVQGEPHTCISGLVEIVDGAVEEGLRPYGVTVDGVFLEDGQLLELPGGGTALYDKATQTLTLTDAVIQQGGDFYGAVCGIQSDDSLTLVLNGSSTISGDLQYGLYSYKNLTIRGSGQLTVSGRRCGITCFFGDTTIEGGVISTSAVPAEEDAWSSISGGINVGGTLNITGGTLQASCDRQCGITGGHIKISGGTVDASGTWGIYGEGEIKVTGGKVTACGDTFGIYCESFAIEGAASATAEGGTAAILAESWQTASLTIPSGYLPSGHYVWESGTTEYAASTIAQNGTEVIYDGHDITGAAKEVTLTKPASSGGSGGSSSGSSTTTTNPDGSTTTTVTKPNGTVTETTKKPDGSQEVVETDKDGTVTTTTTDTTGNKTEVVAGTDGTSQTTITKQDGSSSTTTVSSSGQVVSTVKLPTALAGSTTGQEQAIVLPITSVSATSDQASAPTVTVDLDTETSVKVEVPVTNTTPGTVAVLVKEDGTEEVVKSSVATETGVVLTLSDGDTVKIVDNSKEFDDVDDSYWGAEAVAFTTSRELFVGTSSTTFSPDTAMTRGMLVTTMARLADVDTSSGDTWYAAGQQWAVESGISDGTNMEQTLTREQAATMLWRYAGCPDASADLSGYSDAGDISDYARQAMLWAVEQGLISGTTATTLSPQGEATRAQVAALLMRFFMAQA